MNYFSGFKYQKIYLNRNIENNNFNQEILSIKLNKQIAYKENVILQSLYKSASDQVYLLILSFHLRGFMGFR